MQAHPLSELFDLMGDDELQALADDIKANGLRHKIVTYRDKILDGRNRERACRIAGVTPRYEIYDGKDPLGFVVSVNLHRRHSTPSQLAMTAGRITNLRNGETKAGRQICRPDPDSPEIPAVSQEEAAKLLGVSTRSVGDAKKVLEEGTEADIKKVDKGEASVSATAKRVREKQKAKTKGEPLHDELGVEVPASLRDLFGDPWIVQAATALEEMYRDALKSIRSRVEKKGPRYAFLPVKEIIKAIDTAKAELEVAASLLGDGRLYAVCPKCEGKCCKLCRQSGALPRWRHKELKAEGAL